MATGKKKIQTLYPCPQFSINHDQGFTQLAWHGRRYLRFFVFCHQKQSRMSPGVINGLLHSRSNGFKLRKHRFRLDIRKKYFTIKVVKNWNRLPRKVVEAPSLETFKARVDRALSNLICLEKSLSMAEGLG